MLMETDLSDRVCRALCTAITSAADGSFVDVALGRSFGTTPQDTETERQLLETWCFHVAVQAVRELAQYTNASHDQVVRALTGRLTRAGQVRIAAA